MNEGVVLRTFEAELCQGFLHLFLHIFTIITIYTHLLLKQQYLARKNVNNRTNTWVKGKITFKKSRLSLPFYFLSPPLLI